MIRAVDRYNDSAQIEADILNDIKKKGGCKYHCAYMHESFLHKGENDGDHMCLVFETLGMSLYDFIKNNGYKGFPLTMIQHFAKQTLVALQFLHSINLTHTDLKVSDIFTKCNNYCFC